jgi:hypothetical protein
MMVERKIEMEGWRWQNKGDREKVFDALIGSRLLEMRRKLC